MGRHTTYFSTAPAAYEPAGFLRTTGASGLRTPAIAGAVAVAFWLRATNNGQYGSFLVDFRTYGNGYWWALNAPAGLSGAVIDGVATSSYTAVFAPGWHKVYLEFPTLDQAFYLLCRYSGNEFFFPCDIADITFYGRPFTATEQAAATGPLPTAGVLARYGYLTPTRTGVADSTGRCPALAVIGEPVAETQPGGRVSAAPATYAPASFLRTTGASGLRVPAIAGAVAMAFWLRATDNGQYGSFLVDFRTHGTGYWWHRTDVAGLSQHTIDGISTPSYNAAFAPGWHLVYLEFDTLDQAFYLLCRYSETEFFFPCDVADITFYSRPFTAMEQISGPLPTDGVLACYRYLTPSGTGVADSTGRCPELTIAGEALVAGADTAPAGAIAS
jgi:hypothetical protein